MTTTREGGQALAAEVADAIEKHAEQFDQGEYLHKCGTPACVAGFTVWVAQGRPTVLEMYMQDYGPEWGQRLDSLDVAMDAQAHLALTFNERLEMFHACPYPVNGDDGNSWRRTSPPRRRRRRCCATTRRRAASRGRAAKQAWNERSLVRHPCRTICGFERRNRQ